MNARSTLSLLVISIFVFGLIAPLAMAQDLHESRRPSPMSLARVTLDDGTYVSVTYSRPYKRGRDNIFGTKEDEALVPYGEVWRTGANEATQITTTQDVMVAGKKLPAGTYSLFTVPGKDKWAVHFNSLLGMWGTYKITGPRQVEPGYSADNDVLVVEADASSVEEEVDQFTITFNKQEDGSAHMVISWINTEVRVPFTPAS